MIWLIEKPVKPLMGYLETYFLIIVVVSGEVINRA